MTIGLLSMQCEDRKRHVKGALGVFPELRRILRGAAQHQKPLRLSVDTAVGASRAACRMASMAASATGSPENFRTEKRDNQPVV